MTLEKAVHTIAIAFGVIGITGFFWTGGWTAAVNFAVPFLLVTGNFLYLESLTRKVTAQSPEKAPLFILISMLRYPLIAGVLYAIVSWRHFQKVPAAVGLSAVVFALILYPVLFGGKRDHAS